MVSEDIPEDEGERTPRSCTTSVLHEVIGDPLPPEYPWDTLLTA
jgi:hypothetical protein